MLSPFGQNSVKDNFQGTAQGGINTLFVKNSIIPIPPLSEQRRIVAKIEELFTKLDAGVEALKKAKEQIKRYRQAVLKYAFEGKLTEEWRKSFELLMLNGELKETQNSKLNTQHSKLNIQHPKFSIQSSTFKTENSAFNTQNSTLTTQNSKLPRGWVWTRLDSCSELITKGESPKWQGFNYVEDGIPFIRSENVLWGKVDISNTVKIPIDFHNKLKRSQIKGYDILINLVGASIGRCGVVQPNINAANINQAVALIRTNNLLVPFYLMYLLLSPKFQQIIHSNKVETARPNISLEDLKTLILPLPSFPEQQKIVEEIERRFSVADEVEKAIDNSLKQAERLRQSILKKAFEGKLVPQDPNDEPAEKLLERVRKSLEL
jgi:type I restriction enzyme S subunit